MMLVVVVVMTMMVMTTTATTSDSPIVYVFQTWKTTPLSFFSDHKSSLCCLSSI
jgi:hypothetical protein